MPSSPAIQPQDPHSRYDSHGTPFATSKGFANRTVEPLVHPLRDLFEDAKRAAAA